MSIEEKIVAAALSASTLSDAESVQRLIQEAVGARYERPLFDTVDNYGAATGGSGSYDHKAIEPVTNMQDSVIELAALAKFGLFADVPYQSPHEASKDLFRGVSYENLAARVNVAIRESDPPTNLSKRITLVYRDQGTGISPENVPFTIFGLSSTKKDALWQQGAFGIGGKTTYRNAKAVVLVSRRAPELLGDDEDRVCVAVLEWSFQGKTQTAKYLVTNEWKSREAIAPVYSVPASAVNFFEPGTYLALISYGVESIHTLNFSDERSFYSLLMTRLFVPTLPVGIDRVGGSHQNARGLRQRLEDNPGDPKRSTGTETLPFSVGAETFHLPITFHVFNQRGDAGERRRFVAQGHVVLFTSNGQTQHRWDQNDFRTRLPTLQRLSDRILVIVETDELPIRLRSTLFTADRSAMMRTDDALRLEREVAAFLRDWDELRNIHGELVRAALSSVGSQRTSVNLARELGRAFQGIGMGISSPSLPGRSRQTTQDDPPTPQRPAAQSEPLLAEPTLLDGPESVNAEAGESKYVHVRLNAVDGFIPDRTTIVASTIDTRIGEKNITIGRLTNGKLRISVAIPEDFPEEEFGLTVKVNEWVRASGGVSGPLDWFTRINVVNRDESAAEVKDRNAQSNKSNKKIASAGDMVPVLWKSFPNEPLVVGTAQQLAADEVAAALSSEYSELGNMGHQMIWVLELNQDYTHYKKYNAQSIRQVTERTRDSRAARYALGVGTGILALEVRVQKKRNGGEPVDEEIISLAKQAIAVAVLAELRAYDALEDEAGVQ